MSGRISNLFSTVTRASQEANPEKSGILPSDSLSSASMPSASLYVEPSSVHQLFDLIKRHGNFRLSSNPQGFEAQLGQRRFTIADSSEFIQLTLHHADALTSEAAETTAELALILLPQTDAPLKLQASSIDDERRLWQGVKKFFPRHPISAFNQDQHFRLEFLEKKYNAPEASGAFSGNPKHVSPENSSENTNSSSSGLKLNHLMGGFLKADKFGYKQSSIYIESDSISFLMALAKEHDEVSIDTTREHFRFLLRGHVISIENFQDLSAIRLLSPMNLGAAELMLRILRFIYGDGEAHPEAASTLDNTTSALNPQNKIMPVNLETPANVFNPNYSAHPRNLNNPNNPLSPRNLNHPSNPANPNRLSTIRISCETADLKQEKLILDILKKYDTKAWELTYRNPEQKARIQEYLNHSPSQNSSSLFMQYRERPFGAEINTNSPDLKGGA